MQVSIEELKELAGSGQSESPNPEVNLGFNIVVLDRGFVYVGICTRESDMMVITNARNIRRWGTTKGLGELVDGPLPDTILDQTGTVKAPMRAVICLIKCNKSW